MSTSQDHYSLRWNNHQNHILRAFDTLLQTKTLVDVTLVCAETSIRAHKMVLSACSPFFQRVFAETPCKHPVIVLKDFQGWVVQAIVDFMYRGEISVPQERLQTLIQAGESLQVRGLVENSVPENTPTPAASPDDFGMLEASLLSSELGRCSSFDDDCPTMVSSSGSKLMMPMFASEHNTGRSEQMSQPDLCTSPMPRRKQARPRRRSGECPPHDLNTDNNKSVSPKRKHIKLSDETEEMDEAEDHSEFEDEQSEEPDSDMVNSEIAKNEIKDNDSDIIKDDHENVNNNKNNLDAKTTGCDSKTNEDNEKEPKNETKIDRKKSPPRDENGNKTDTVSEVPENLCTKKLDDTEQKQKEDASNNNSNSNNKNNNNNNNNNNNRIVLSLKDIRHINKQSTNRSSKSPSAFQPSPLDELRSMRHHSVMSNDLHHNMKNENLERHLNQMDSCDRDSPIHFDHMDLSMAAAAAAAAHHHQQQMNALGAAVAHHSAHNRGQLERLEESLVNRMNKDFPPTSPISLPGHYNPQDGQPHPPSPLPFPGMSSALALTPPHMFGLDSPLGLFPPGMDPGKLYNPLMEMSDPRGMPNDHPPFLKGKKIPRPKGQHSAPRGGPPRSWTNAELTEALQHVWNKKMTTSQASRIFGIPYNSLLMYVRGKYGKSLKLEQLRKDCISGPPIELLQMGINSSNGGSGGNGSSSSSEKRKNRQNELKDLDGLPQNIPPEELLQGGNSLFNPFPPGFYPDFPSGFPGLPLSMLNLLPPERHPSSSSGGPGMNMDEDCKSDRSKQSLDDDFTQPLALNRDVLDRRELLMQPNGQD